jgi:syntaxin 18
MDFEAAHLAGITLHLSHELASVSQQQTEMQEQRRNLQMEQTQTLASTAQRELAAERVRGEMPAQPPRYPGDEHLTAGASGWFSQHASSIASSITGLAPKDLLTPREPQASFTHAPLPPDDDESDGGDLTEAQLHVFESENAALLRTVQSDIAALQQAESRLLEISALQSELVVHLTQQTELTDQLYEDAIASTDLVQRGNLQLKEARRRSKDSRLFILVFLIGASFALLFLHYY